VAIVESSADDMLSCVEYSGRMRYRNFVADSAAGAGATMRGKDVVGKGLVVASLKYDAES